MSGLDPSRARVVLRDRAIADVWDLALRFLASRRLAYGRLALVTLIPLGGLSLAVGAIAGWAYSWIAAVPLAIAAETPFTILASRLVFEDEVRVRDVVLEALARGPSVLFGRLVCGVIAALGLPLFLVPGLWLALTTLFVSEVMLLERAKLGAAFERAQRIASAATADGVLGVLFTHLVPVAAVLLLDYAGRSLLGEVLQVEPPRAVWTTGGSALAVVALFLQAPYRASARFFLYLNVRTRTEGWDIQTRFAGIAARAEAEG